MECTKVSIQSKDLTRHPFILLLLRKRVLLFQRISLGCRRVLMNPDKFVPNLGECFCVIFYCKKINIQQKLNWVTKYGITPTQYECFYICKRKKKKKSFVILKNKSWGKPSSKKIKVIKKSSEAIRLVLWKVLSCGDVAPLELIGLGSSSSMESFTSWILMATEWRRRVERRRHFKEKMSQEEAHHHRKPWIRAWR